MSIIDGSSVKRPRGQVSDARGTEADLAQRLSRFMLHAAKRNGLQRIVIKAFFLLHLV
jgi:hypothetical protein